MTDPVRVAHEAAIAVVAALSTPAVLVNADERVEAANGTARSILGGEVVGLHYVAAFRQPAILDVIEQVLRSGAPRTGVFRQYRETADSTFHVTVTAPVIAGARNALIAFEDVSAVEEATQMRRDFIANVSHELRTPLTAVSGFVETLLGAARHDPGAQERFLGIIGRETVRMTRLVDELLTLSRVEGMERRRPTAPVSLAELIRSGVAALAPVAEASGVRLFVADDLPDRSVPGDTDQLRQVISNLIENAVKYGGADKTVHITLTGPEPEPSLRAEAMRLSVRDEGEGIAAHHLPRLTERFYRVDSHRSRDLGGTGLGLAIVKHIVARHRGRLRIESTPGHGSTFTVLLPVD